MSTSTTISSFDAALKQIYEPDNYRLSTYEDRPMFAMLPKDENFGGRNMPLVNRYGNPQGVGSVFSTAQTNSTAMKIEDFDLTRVTEYSVAQIDGEVIEASETEQYAFLDALTAKIDAAMDALMDTIESYIPRSGTGSIGQVSSGSNVATATVTLSDPADAHNFEVGMVLVAAATDGAGALRANSEVLRSVNRATGDLGSTNVAWNTSLAVQASDYLFRQSDAKGAGSTNLVITGFAGWCPSTAPSASENFFSVDRSVDSRLYGNYYDGSSGSIEEALINGQSLGSQVGGKITDIFINHTKFRRFKLELGQKEWLTKHAQGPDNEEQAISFAGLVVQGDRGPIAVIPANKCQGSKAWALQMNTWVLASLGAFPKLLKQDGLTILRQATADGYEVRVGGRGNLGCKKPGSNVQINLPS